MPRFGLILKAGAVLVLVFVAAFIAIHELYLPYLSERAFAHLTEVSDDCLDESAEVMRRQALHMEDANRRELLDLPFELTDGAPERTRSLVAEQTTGFGRTYLRNSRLLSREFRRRMGILNEARGARLAETFRSDAVTGLTILLSSLLLLFGAGLAITVLLPIGRLLRATERVAEGELDQRVALGGRDEVGRLGRAFDRMTASLASSREEIEGLNRTLADKVEEKTEELRRNNRELAETNAKLTETIEELQATRDALVHGKTMASIGTLAGGVAHEFNNLLGGILGCAEDLRSEEDPDELREGLDMILRTGRRACNITENLLRFSRPPDRLPRETDLAGLVREAVDLVRPETQKRKLSIESEFDELPPVRVDPGQIHQVVLNLLTNAIHATGAGGVIRVRVRSENGGSAIVVTDTGVGIPAEHVDRIFTPFFTTRDASGEDRGTGLGLSVSYSIVKAHGGEITVSSRPGEGATFTVVLPAVEEEES